MSPDQPQPAGRICGICWREFIPSRANNIYCSKRCKNTAFDRKRRPQKADAEGAGRQHTVSSSARPQPAAVRDCPHCGGPVTIVALLTTPEAARPTPPAAVPDTVIPLHRP
ncbi:hypothetical protein ATK30_0785 [Amycolatopsis echigonensis]|uniref:Uncharacterized protein n=1 Tax=Amycolatopsis echigonensis TaxID=2576905 RepID=A0A2N3X112_9PSEU|nr:hypothetical protein ATK30_0785 [Amycolatopsis niigatensis]